jgi:cytochrome c oxidase subunit III
MSQTHVAHHFDDLEQQQDSAVLGMWIFLATEVLFFGAMFACYTAYRYMYGEAFALASHHMAVWLGALNTAILLASSFTMVLSVHAAQTRAPARLTVFLLLTAALGAAFLGVKAVEYADHIGHHQLPGASFSIEGDFPRQQELFYVFYWTMTGIHAVHLVIGIAIVLVLASLSRSQAFLHRHGQVVDMTGLYWHFVDIVWIFLYPLFYLIHPRF